MNTMLGNLFDQHRGAEQMLERLAGAALRLRREGVQPDILKEFQACREVLEGEVGSHFREEEQGLFPVLGRHVGLEDGPIAAMMEEHARLRQLELVFEGSLAALEYGHPGEWAESLLRAAEEIGRLLPLHIAKEDEVLFPLAESMLTEADWDECRTLWARSALLIP